MIGNSQGEAEIPLIWCKVFRRVRVQLNATEATGCGPGSATNVEARVTLWLS
jgi:hypothetical protein